MGQIKNIKLHIVTDIKFVIGRQVALTFHLQDVRRKRKEDVDKSSIYARLDERRHWICTLREKMHGVVETEQRQEMSEVLQEETWNSHSWKEEERRDDYDYEEHEEEEGCGKVADMFTIHLDSLYR